MEGASPRMRGKAKNRCRSCPLTRITPAYAGKSLALASLMLCHRDHPRVCGEKNACWGVPQTPLGSPPRMRGKEACQRPRHRPGGITPAYAGKSTTAGRGRMPFRDHPRVCGEKFNGMTDDELQEGSPPRMRGKVRRSKCIILCYGITPAYAGKRKNTTFKMDGGRDHPRVCGEKPFMVWLWVSMLGSPPRMRGKVYKVILECSGPGITPAYAGKSFLPSILLCRNRDHPRVCGEKSTPPGTRMRAPGSPPRMRGKVP